VHDLSFEHRPRDYSLYDRAWQRLARPAGLARRAERVLCVSEATRRAVMDEWGVEPGRARTVLPGPGRPPRPGRAPAAELPPAVPDAFVLAVGALEPRKLPGLLVEAHHRARDAGLRAGLVFAGDGPLRADIERGGAIVLGHVPDVLLDALYDRALAVSCVSREEGFGFTPLEALARGTPAVVTELPVFDETLGDGALRVAAGDVAGLADVLLRLEREPELRERLAEAGRAAVARLSWEEAARATREALAEAAR
jgi:glycosyltransferase involved in cell wall biosynthesis